MKIAALHKSSFVDYPGKIAAVAFTPGCNLNCFYCHNRALVEGGDDLMTIPPSKVLGFLRKRQGLLDAVVITGGEPTIQSGLADFIQEIRCLGYLIKLDTNGTHPEVLESLINAGLLDYVAMDAKAPPEKYNSICGAAVDLNAVNASIDLLLAGRIDYEFRTTIVPQLTNADILDIGWRIRGARAYVLQRYRRPEPVAPGLRFNKPPGPASCMPGILEKLKVIVQRCAVRGFDNSHSQKTEISIPILSQ
jgi:pyruvate formate lyase activating enzyme